MALGDLLDKLEAEDRYRWRPAVGPYRAGRVRSLKAPKAAPGQMLLAGLEPDAGPEPPPTGRIMTCPNCGSTEFDDDGDCTQCWEPAVTAHPRQSED